MIERKGTGEVPKMRRAKLNIRIIAANLMFGFIETFYFVPLNPRVKQYVGEFLGTFFLVLVGTGAIVLNDYTQGRVTHLGISFAFGGVVTAMIYAFGKWSGAHINPAVTIAFWVGRRRWKPNLLLRISYFNCSVHFLLPSS